MKWVSYYRLVIYASDNNVIDIPMVVEKTGLSSETIKKYLKKLVQEGLVERRGDSYVLTEIGVRFRDSLKALMNRRDAPPYVITDPMTGSPIHLSFKNYEQLLAIIKTGLVDETIVEKHLEKYMARWIRDALGDSYAEFLITQGKIKTAKDLERYLETMIFLVRELST
ncbi:MAG: winged helix-turn-helix domain-containing protein [Desulfurococcaceae archaeon]